MQSLLTVVVIDRGGGGMEPIVPTVSLLTAVAVDGGDGNGAVAAAVDDNN
jgi:hypothetical protein